MMNDFPDDENKAENTLDLDGDPFSSQAEEEDHGGSSNSQQFFLNCGGPLYGKKVKERNF